MGKESCLNQTTSNTAASSNGNGAGHLAEPLSYESNLPPLDPSGEAIPVYYGLALTAWVKIGIVTVLMCLTFRFNLARLWLKTNPFFGEPNWRHAVCVPLIGLYYLYVNRDEITKAPVHTAWSGLGILVFGILSFVYGIYPGQNDFIKDLGMVIALFGVVTLLAGWQVMKVTWFPILFLICAIPWPELVYSKVASPLQHLAASVAVGTLRYTGVDALNIGNKIIISHPGRPDRTLNVAEACAGLRSLMTFISVAGAVAFLSIRPMWQKVVITTAAIPIAVFCNVMRVSGQGLLDHYWSEELAEGFAHQFVGIIMLVPGFFLILLTGWMLDKVFIEESEHRAEKGIVRAGSGQKAQWNLPKKGLMAKESAIATALVVAPVAKSAKPTAGTVATGRPSAAAPRSVRPAAKPAASAANPGMPHRPMRPAAAPAGAPAARLPLKQPAEPPAASGAPGRSPVAPNSGNPA